MRPASSGEEAKPMEEEERQDGKLAVDARARLEALAKDADVAAIQEISVPAPLGY